MKKLALFCLSLLMLAILGCEVSSLPFAATPTSTPSPTPVPTATPTPMPSLEGQQKQIFGAMVTPQIKDGCTFSEVIKIVPDFLPQSPKPDMFVAIDWGLPDDKSCGFNFTFVYKDQADAYQMWKTLLSESGLFANPQVSDNYLATGWAQAESSECDSAVAVDFCLADRMVVNQGILILVITTDWTNETSAPEKWLDVYFQPYLDALGDWFPDRLKKPMNNPRA